MALPHFKVAPTRGMDQRLFQPPKPSKHIQMLEQLFKNLTKLEERGDAFPAYMGYLGITAGLHAGANGGVPIGFLKLLEATRNRAHSKLANAAVEAKAA